MITPPHDRPFAVSSVGLIPGRVRRGDPAFHEAAGSVKELVKRSRLLVGAPFTQVSLIIREGTKVRLDPEFERLRRDGELDIAVEVPLHALKTYEPIVGSPDRERNHGYLEAEYRSVMLKALLGVCQKYQLADDVSWVTLAAVEKDRAPGADQNLERAAEI